MHPMISQENINHTHNFFIEYINGRGKLPAIQIGDQPYGILPTTVYSRINWFKENVEHSPLNEFNDFLPYIEKLYKFLNQVRDETRALTSEVAYVGDKNSTDAHKVLLNILGLHATSVEFDHRIAFSKNQIFNWLLYVGLATGLLDSEEERIKLHDIVKKVFMTEEVDLLTKEFNWDMPNDLALYKKLFKDASYRLSGPLIDSKPLSETALTYDHDENTENYITQLGETILNSIEALASHPGFEEGTPKPILYLLLRHSLLLCIVKVSIKVLKLYGNRDINWDDHRPYIEQAFICVKFDELREGFKFQKKWDYLNEEISVDGASTTVSEYITKALNDYEPDKYPIEIDQLHNIITALNVLNVPTARLERAMAEHIDCCSYRLDAWLQGLVNFQLSAMRFGVDQPESPVPGIYLGAYGWVENLKPDTRLQSAVNLDPELKEIFDPNDQNDIVTDTSNAGYIHAPSLAQATTAAVLRNAYLSHASNDDQNLFAINLSSERVRIAISIIQGIQQGQSLGALLGYRLERALHDRHNEQEIDVYIYELRKAFPFRANRISDTSITSNLESITQIEARNVVDGFKLLEHIDNVPEKDYPYGKDLKVDNSDITEIITQEVNELRNIHDALADLSIAESVHQVVQSNYDRASGVLDTYSRGGLPQIPEVSMTPRSGISLVNRVGNSHSSYKSSGPHKHRQH